MVSYPVTCPIRGGTQEAGDGQMRSASRHRGEAGGGWFGFPPLLATDGRIHKGDCDMRTGAIFARGSCRALKWLALFGVVFALGVGTAAAQVTVTVSR